MRLAFLLAWLTVAPAAWQASSPTPPKQPIASSTTASTQQAASKNKPAESFWQRTTSDPVALYTLVLAIFTGLLVIVSAIQGAFLLRADKTARITANAAAESARVAKDTLHLANRAHLQFDNWRIGDFQPKQVPVVSFDVLNSGHTAAELVGFRAAYTDTDPPPPTPEHQIPIGPKHGLVRPSEKGMLMSFEAERPISEEAFQAIVSFNRAVYVWGELIYKDIFGDEHRTGFGIELWLARSANGGWDAYPIDKPGYNYAD